MHIERIKNKILLGDALTKLKEFPDESIDCVMTSPPYWNLRNYGIKPSVWDEKPECEHEWNHFTRKGMSGGTNSAKVQVKGSRNFQWVEATKQAFCAKCSAWRGCLGLEPTYGLFIKHLVDIFDEIKRVLKPTGSAWIVLGDTYSTQGGQNRDTMKDYSGYKSIRLKSKMMGVPLVKSKELPSKSLCQIPSRFAIEMASRRWILRNVIIWHKPNCMPESVKDRFTVDFEYLFFFVKSKRYWFAQQHEPLSDSERLQKSFSYQRIMRKKSPYSEKYFSRIKPKSAEQSRARMLKLGRNKRCVWTIPTKSFTGAHFAVYPEALCVTPILAGCAKGGIVLDPFMGSGTTAVVARKLERNYIGIELNQKYITLAEKRLAQQAMI